MFEVDSISPIYELVKIIPIVNKKHFLYTKLQKKSRTVNLRVNKATENNKTQK